MILNNKISKSLLLKGLFLILPLTISNSITYSTSAQINPNQPPRNQNSSGRSLTVRSDIQEADARTGVVTARGKSKLTTQPGKFKQQQLRLNISAENAELFLMEMYLYYRMVIQFGEKLSPI